MTNLPHLVRFSPIALLAALALVSSTGCVAFRIGDPEVITAEFQNARREQRVLSRSVVSAGPVVVQKRDLIYIARADSARGLGLAAAMEIPPGQADVVIPGNLVRKYGIENAAKDSVSFRAQVGLTLHVGLGGTVRVRERDIDPFRKFEVTRQRRLAFGLFPGFAEKQWRPDGALYPLVGKYDKGGRSDWRTFEDGSSFSPIRGLLITPWALVGTPLFGSFHCRSHYWKGTNIDKLDLLSPEKREELAINTRPLTKEIARRGSIAHSAWLGFHRYENLSISEQGFSRLDAREVTTNRAIRVTGPYLVEVRIPSLRYQKTLEILPGESSEAFVLPPVARDTEVDVQVRFLEPPYRTVPIPSGNEQAVFDEALGKTYGAKLLLRAPAPPPAPTAPAR